MKDPQTNNSFLLKCYCSIFVVATSIYTELWAHRVGLTICKNLNLLVVEIEVDAHMVLGWILDNSNGNLHYASLILDGGILIGQIFQVKMKHSFYEVNKCTDTFVREGSKIEQGFDVFDSPHVDLLFAAIL